MDLELLNFPLALFQRAREHAAGVQRELDVLRVEDADVVRVPRRIDDVVADLDTRFTGYRSTMDALDGLVDEGADHADVRIPVVGDAEERAAAVQELAELLDEIDAYCEAGDELLTVVTPPELRDFRAWLFSEVIGQLRGATPSPWVPGRVDGRVEGRVDGRTDGTNAVPATPAMTPRGDDEPIVVRLQGSLDLGEAARVREQLQSAFTAQDMDVVADLTEVDFVDSVILSVLITAHKRFVAEGRHISFLVSPDLRRLFELTGLLRVLDVRTA